MFPIASGFTRIDSETDFRTSEIGWIKFLYVTHIKGVIKIYFDIKYQYYIIFNIILKIFINILTKAAIKYQNYIDKCPDISL